jgi:hypothetical protein
LNLAQVPKSCVVPDTDIGNAASGAFETETPRRLFKSPGADSMAELLKR